MDGRGILREVSNNMKISISNIQFSIEHELDSYNYKHDKIELLDQIIIYAANKKQEIKRRKK